MKRAKKASRLDLSTEASIRILKVREQIYAGLSSLFKQHQLTEPQYNVLRILEGAGAEGLPCLEIGRRMITRLPDITRLLDRLETQSLITRDRSRQDRRVVIARITSTGRDLLDAAHEPVLRYHREFCSELSKRELLDLIELLDGLLPQGRLPKP